MASKLELIGLSYQQSTYCVAIPVFGESEDEARGKALKYAITKYFPSTEGYYAQQVTLCEVPHNWMMHYTQQFAMPIIKKAP